ncbi:uncharacterized protein LOC101241605 isoform X1 [Hydra vulgaris]|uniref:uncharacterized protein LOC101241605 isoform X1 n=1 Tax=Hydra vulgaris TaxID=6087 RepID=UPI001F5E4BD6|nr:uncharacterized protein LOC101241605 isoform X2 [Hydra vulgaris]
MTKNKMFHIIVVLFFTWVWFTNADYYQMDLTPVIVFSTKTDDDIRPGALKNTNLNWGSIIILSFSEEYFITQAAVFSYSSSQGSNVCQKNYQVYLQSSDGLNNLNGYGTQNGVSKYNSLYKSYLCYYNITFSGMNAKFLVLNAYDTMSIAYIAVYAFVFRKPDYFDNPNLNEYEISEAFFSSSSIYSLDQIKNMVMNLSSPSMTSLISTTLGFESSVVAWFSVKLDRVQLVHQFIIASTDSSIIQNVLLFFRLNDDRDYISYKENNVTKVFTSDLNTQWCSYNLMHTFKASEILVYVQSGALLQFNFRFVEAVQYKFKKPIIGSFIFAETDWFLIKLNETMLITGIAFNNINWLKKFCVYYDLNSEYVPYRDNILFTDDIIFAVTPEVSFFPFRTKNLKLACFKWFGDVTNNLTVNLKGSHYLIADYTWKSGISNQGGSLVEYINAEGIDTLYGDSRNLQKINSFNRLMSNHYGDSCFTQPNLCDTGFTVQIVVSANLTSEDVVFKFRPSFAFYVANSLVDEPQILYFGCISQENNGQGNGNNIINIVSSFLFADIMLPSNAEVTGFSFNLNNIETIGFVARVYVLVSQSDTFRNSFLSLKYMSYASVINKLITSDYITMLVNGSTNGAVSNSLNLKDVLEKVRLKYYGLVRDIGIVIIANNLCTNNILVKVNRINIELAISYKNKVVGNIELLMPLNIINVPQSVQYIGNGIYNTVPGYKKIIFSQVYYITTMQIGSKSTLAISVTLNTENSDYFDASYYTFIDQYYLNSGEIQYVTFKGVLQTKLFYITSSSIDLGVINLEFYGSKDALCSSSLVSAGLSGYSSKIDGYGFHIHLSSSNNIVATVATKDYIYETDLKNPTMTPYTLTMVWSKQNNSIQLFLNGTLIANDSILETNINSTYHRFLNQYLLMYSDYYNNQSDLRGSLSSIKIWSASFSSEEVLQLYEQSYYDWNSLDAYPPSGFNFGSDCYCENVLCPCETSDKNSSVEYSSRFSIIKDVAEDDFFDENFFMESPDYFANYSTIYFDNIVLDFQNIKLLYVHIQGNLFLPNNNSCFNLTMQFLNDPNFSAHTQWCNSTSAESIDTPDLSLLLSDLLKTVFYTIPFTIVVKITDTFLNPGCVMKIDYELPLPGGFIHASAVQENSQDLLAFISLDVTGTCLSYKFKFGGEGFVSLNVLGYTGSITKELAFFYRREGLNKWVNSYVDLSKNSEKFCLVKFVALKNGLGSGYIAFGTIQFLSSCDELTIKEPADMGNSYMLSNGSFLFPNPKIFIRGSSELFINISNAVVSRGSNTNLLQFIDGHNEQVYKKTLSFVEVDLSKDFSFVFWYQSNSFQVLRFTYEKIVVVNSQASALILIFDSVQKVINIDSSVQWHYVVVKYERKFLKLSFDVDFNTGSVFDEVQFPQNSSMEIVLENNIFCFQMHNEVLFPSALKAAQLCMMKSVENACTKRKSDCEWCNPFYGEWELYPWEYIFDKNGACLQDLNDFNKTLYQPFNMVVNDSFAAGIFNSYEVKISSEVQSVLGFINNGLLTESKNVVVADQDILNYFSNNSYMFSTWVKHTCEVGYEYTPIISTSIVVLLCGITDTNVSFATPTLVFYDNCMYALPGKSGLWYNFAFVYNKSILIYIDGELVQKTECLATDLPFDRSLQVNNVQVSSVGSYATLLDEVFVGDVAPSVLFWRQLLGYYYTENIKQMTNPTQFGFCSNEPWIYDNSLPGTYLYEKVVNILQPQITNLLQLIITELLLAEISSIKKGSSNNVCGGFNVYITVQSTDVLQKIASIKNENIQIYPIYPQTDQLLEYYSIFASYKVLRQNRTSVVLSLELLEDERYPISKIYIQWTQKDGSNTNQSWSNTANFILISPLKIFTEYYVCFSFETIRRKLSSCMQQKNTFWTAEGEPVQYPSLSCAANQVKKTMDCDVTKISISSWHGIPYSYNIMYRVKTPEDSCNSLESQFNQSQYNFSISYSATLNNPGNIRVSFNTSEYHFLQLCVIAYATTQGGNGIGVANYQVVRTQSTAPDNAPDGLKATFNNSVITFEWYPLESSVDVWNDYTVPGTYYLTYGILKSSIPIALDSPSTVVVSGNKYVLKNGSLCHVNIAFINAFSVAMGPASFKICFLSSLTKPDCVNPVIKEYYVVDPRTAVFLPEIFDPTYFRGINKSWLFNVQVKEGYNPGQIAAKYLYSPYYFDLPIEKYAERSMLCIDEDLSQFLNQNNNYNITLMGLHPNTSYQVSIQPCNEYGCGKISNPVFFNTYSDIPSCSPEFLHLQNESSTSMIVSWNELDISCANGNIENYILKCHGNQSGLLGNISTDLSVELINLHKYEFICCRIAVRNINGTGPFSSEICAFTDEDVPNDAPISSKIKTTFSSGCISILAPKIVDMNGIVLGIQANITNLTIANSETSLQQQSYSKDYEFIFKADHLYKGFVNICFDQLLPFFVYSVELRYFNSIGYSPSSTYQFVTEEYFPEAPSLISFSSDNVQIITVNWSSVPIEKSNGIISRYLICRKQVLDKNILGEEVCFNYTNLLFLNFNLTNLNRGSTHNVSVAACNKAGCGKKIYILASAMGFTDGHWLDWSNWGACSQTCDQGQKMRTRVCTPHSVGGYDCFGTNTSFEICQVTKCSGFVLGREGETNCSVVCAKDNYLCSPFYLKPYNDTSIFLNAITPIKCRASLDYRVYSSDLDPSLDNSTGVCHGYINIPDEVPCESKNTFNQPKMHRLCNCISPNDYGFALWARWSFCSETCGNTSIQVRKRNCLGVCSGNSVEVKLCDVPVCPVDGEWGSWGNYSACNSTCGYGYQIRTRECNNPSTIGSGTPCQGIQKDEKPECNAFPCPVDGGYSNWTDWSICSRPCGEGVTIRRRYCNNPVPAMRGKECNGSDLMTMPCFLQNCKSIRVDLIQRTFETWMWKMYNIKSEEAYVFVQRFNQSVYTYFKEKNLNGLQSVDVTLLKAGSIVVYYTLTFEYLYDQMVEFIDGINQYGKITNISIENTQLYSSNDVFCTPPYNISAVAYDKNTVMLSWVRDACVNQTDIWLYVYYKDITSSNSTWEWRGLDSSKQWGLLPDLITSHKYKAYMLTALSIGNGLPSTVFYFETSPFPPERPPPYAYTFSPSSTEIYIEWTDIPEEYQNGPILGYKIKYKIYINSESFQMVEAQFGFNAFTIKNLRPFTLYLVEVYGYNVNGDGPAQYSMCKTVEGVPSIPVPKFVVNDMQSISWWSVSWGPIPSEYVNGILLGYQLVYYLSYQSGVEISGEKTKITLVFDIYTRYYKQRNLLNYAIYSVSVAGFTATGSGPAPEYQARTCKCAELLYANIYIKNPFTSLDADLTPSGFFIKLLQDTVVQSCGSCKGYNSSKLYFTQSKYGDDPVKSSELDLKNAINKDVDLSFPIYGVNGREVAPDSKFSVLVVSPGIAMVVRNENTINQVIKQMVLGVLNVWPVLLISYAIAFIFGIFIWFSDQFSNPSQFSKGSSLRGPMSGFWFTFVTMTTIGYGDLSPRSVLARIFAMVWFLTGLILNGLIIAFIVTKLTVFSSNSEYMLYNTKVAVLDNSFENKLAIISNADVSKDIRYTNISSMLEDLHNKVVDIVYIDVISLLDYQSALDAKSLVIASIDNRNTGYGFVMSGESAALTIDINSYLSSKRDEISAFTASFSSRIPGLLMVDSSQIIANMFSKDSPAFQQSLLWLVILIVFFTVGALIYEIVMRKKKCKVGAEATFAEKLFLLKDQIQEFRENFDKLTSQIINEQDEERVQLADLKNIYIKKYKQFNTYKNKIKI